MTYGQCPICEGDVIMRERRPNGNSRCVNGHVHASKDTKQSARSATDFDVLFGAIIKRSRKGEKLSQTKLGEKIGVTCQQVQKYEKGETRVPFSRAALICRTLKLRIETVADEILYELGEQQ